jgi:hypothetical protein
VDFLFVKIASSAIAQIHNIQTSRSINVRLAMI